ncbi:hypothetical protein SO802_020180 [Lithocarpus litseifolius]|uniref:Uncharacterized protein n=1 Tax=Lithocarpus litseifolius TaxID=425828 RepID=A0AAW2CF74_9ROSI
MEINTEYVKRLQEGDGYLDLVKKGNNSQSLWSFVTFIVGAEYMPFKNLVFLLSTKDGGGIETCINIKEEDIYSHV